MGPSTSDVRDLAPALRRGASKRYAFDRMRRFPLIEADPSVCHGKPCIAGTRILVSSILSQLAAGYSFERIRAGYPELTDEHVRAAVEYARSLVDDEDVLSLIP
jgi:uncharacterized protein (DUF433 family)